MTNIIRLEPFVHLRFIDLSNNRLRSINSLNRLKFLLTLKVDSNELSSIDLAPLPYLQILSLSNNRLRSVHGIEQPRLETLNLARNDVSRLETGVDRFPFAFADNQINTCAGLEHDKLPNLITLELRENQLTTTKGIALPNLKSLFLVRFSFSRFMETRLCLAARLGGEQRHSIGRP